MATIKFYTRSKINDKLATVWIRFRDGRDIDISLPTPLSMVPDYWNESKQALKQRIIYNKGVAEVNGQMKHFTETQAKTIADKFIQLKDSILTEKLELTRPVSKHWLKSCLDKFFKTNESNNEDLNSYIERFIREATTGERLCFSGKVKKPYSDGTIRSMRDFQTSFDLYQGLRIKRDYGQEVRKYKKRKEVLPTRPVKILNWQDITIDWYNEYLNYFYSRKCSPNYVGKHLKTFKAILRQAKDEGYPVNSDVERKAFKVISAEVDSIYLTEAELKKLYDLDLSNNKYYEVARDVFLVGCYTAQRYSDYSRITKSMFRTTDGVKYLEFNQQKTGEKVIIPLRPECDAILQKYDYTLPKSYEQKINDRIKDVGKLAGITEVIYFEKNKGGLIVKEKAAKCDLIKTHTARRSGCTNMYLAKIPVIDIMKISGHRTEREFLKYIRVTKEETAVSLASHTYFSGLKAV